MTGHQPAAPASDAMAAPGTQWMPLAQVVALAEQHQLAGNLPMAEQLCRQVLQARPDHAEALHLLGIVAHQAGDTARAIELIRQAIAANGAVALYHCNLGEMCRILGRTEEAVTAGRQALALNPNYTSALNNLAIAHYDRGEYGEAVACYRRALAIEPGFAEAQSNLGNALRAQGELDQAVAAYRQAIKLKPNYADAYNNLGTALRDARRHDEAERAYRQALALRPMHGPTLNNLALNLKDQGRLDDAIGVLTQSAALAPGDPKTFVYLASMLLDRDQDEGAAAAARQAYAVDAGDPDVLNMMGRIAFVEGRSADALEFYRRTLVAKPDMADAYNNMGNALKEIGRSKEALDAYRKALRIDPKMIGTYVNLADSKKFKEGDGDLATMEALLSGGATLTEVDEMQLNFALSKAYGDLGQAPQSFEHLRRGNALKRRRIAYDEPAALGIFERIRASFTAERLRRKQGHGDPSEAPVFILGMPRSGTTLVEQILASHPRVHGAGELRDFTGLANALSGPSNGFALYPEFLDSLAAGELRELGADYVARLRGHDPAALRITDKMPSNFYFVGLIYLALPNARIIHTRRDPVDTCLSCFSKLFVEEQNHTYDLAELGRYYRRYEALMEHWRNVLPEGRMLEVRYEELVADFEPWARRLVAHCGLDWDDACLAFHKTDRPVRTASAMQVRQPIYRTAIGRWRPYAPYLGPLLAELGIETPAE